MAEEATVLFARGNRQVDSESSEDDVWDDTALIEAYDRAVSLAKEDIHRRMGLHSAKTDGDGTVSSSLTETGPSNFKAVAKKEKIKQYNKPRNVKYKNTVTLTTALSANGDKWRVGMPCRSVYHEDGELYEAVIETISIDNGVCMLKFVGYDNQQLTRIDDLIPSEGRWAQKQQIQLSKDTAEDTMDWMNTEAGKEVSDTGALPKCDRSSQKLPFSAIPPPLPPSLLSAKLPGEESEALSSMLMSWYLNGFHTGYYMGLKQGKEDISSPPSKR